MNLQFSVMYVKMMVVNSVLIFVWDVRKVKHYTQETMQIYCLVMVHTCVRESGVCVTDISTQHVHHCTHGTNQTSI
jgi:hypothetical protein